MTSPPAQTEAEYQLDPLGDVILIVTSPTEPERHLRASCKTLCLASSVSKAMIVPDSSFSKKRFSRINLVDDNFDALLLVLRAVHLQNRLISFNISAEKLFHVAVVCDKYDLTDSIKPWIEIWIRNFKDVAQTSRYERWLRISWVFQRAAIFENVTRRLILETEFDSTGNLMTEGGENFAEGIPDTVIDDITTHRRDLIEMLIRLVRDEFDRYRLCVTKETYVCMRSSHTSSTKSKVAQCDVTSLGTLTKYLICWNLWPDCQASAWKRSPATLMRSLREMPHYGDAIVHTWSNKGNPKDTHDQCGPRNSIVKAIDTYFTNNFICCKLPGSVSELVLSDDEIQ